MMSRMLFHSVILMALTLGSSSWAQGSAEARESVAVLDFAAQGVESHVASIVTQNVTIGIDRLGVFKAISAEDIKSMLSAEALKQAVGCSENSCLAEIAGAVGAQYLVTGSVGKLGASYQISITLIDQAAARTLDRVVRQDEVELAELPQIAQIAARQVMRSLLESKQGLLDLVIGEAGADVFLDDSLIGVSPLVQPVQLSQGPHRLKVQKHGFIDYKKDIEIQANETHGLRVQLIPSAEYRQSYRSLHGTLRTLAWLSTGLGLVSGLVAGGSLVINGQQQSEADQLIAQNSAVFGSRENPQILQPNAPEVTQYKRLQSDTALSAVLAYASGGLAAASVIAATVLWVVGEDPNRYE